MMQIMDILVFTAHDGCIHTAQDKDSQVRTLVRDSFQVGENVLVLDSAVYITEIVGHAGKCRSGNGWRHRPSGLKGSPVL